MFKPIINWILKQYKERELKEIDEYIEFVAERIRYWADDSGGLKELLWELIFPHDIKPPVDLKKRYVIYNKLSKDRDNEELFRSLYAKNYMAYVMAKNDDERNILKGRMAQLQDILNNMEHANEKLQNWDEVEKLNDKKSKLKINIQEKYLTK